jgi:hypothetical protein
MRKGKGLHIKLLHVLMRNTRNICIIRNRVRCKQNFFPFLATEGTVPSVRL